MRNLLYAGMGGVLAAHALSQQPANPLPAINYDIVAVKMPIVLPQDRHDFPDASNHSLYVGADADLVLIHPNGTQSMLVDASDPFGTGMDPYPDASCVDPCISFDGQTVFFAWFEDPENHHYQRDISVEPAHIMKVDVATGSVTQLTFGDDIEFLDQARQVDPGYAKFDVAPVELPDGRLLFLSNREGTMDVATKLPSMRFYRMEADGTNIEPLENFSQGSCQHPIILTDGRIVWTHFHPAGRRTMNTGNYPLMVANPDMSTWRTFAGVHYENAAWHFTGQLSNGDVVTTGYYHFNNFGHGSILRMPLNPTDPTGNGQLFWPKTPTTMTWNPYGHPNHAEAQYTGGNDHFARIGETVVTPWILAGGSVGRDELSPLLGGQRVGKVTMPSGAPGGHMLCIHSEGGVNAKGSTFEPPEHMRIVLFPNGTSTQPQDMIVVEEDSGFHYMYPKALVPYSAIYGIAAPPVIPDVANDGSLTSVLPAGSPFATIGTSSVYNRESDWPSAFTDEWSENLTNNYSKIMAFFEVGQDRLPFPDSRIHAAQVVVDMSHVDNRFAGATNFKSHNNGTQVWGVLGEIPLRKYTDAGKVINDLQGNPDTSYEVRIPADTPVHNRLLDILGLTLTAEETWHSPVPGERNNSCGGCHAHSNDTAPLDFNTTMAASEPITDFALQTPLLNRPGSAQPVTNHPERFRIVEFHRDVRPVLDAHCISCHQGPNPDGGLDLKDPTPHPVTGALVPVADVLAYEAGVGGPSGASHPPYTTHQATRWVRKNAAAQSLLVWKTFGRRLDGRGDSSRNDDVDFGPNHLAAGITFDEMRTIAMWVDLGSLVDLTPGSQDLDCFDDQMRPTLTVQGVDWSTATAPLPTVNVGVFDVHSGIQPNSLSVVATEVGNPGNQLVLSVPSVGNDGGTFQVNLASVPAGKTWDIEFSVKDDYKIGTQAKPNVSRRRYRVAL